MTINATDPEKITPNMNAEKLPDCMLPGGADPCAGYQELYTKAVEMELLLADIKEDLLLRSDKDSEDLDVVNISNSIWHRLKKIIKDS